MCFFMAGLSTLPTRVTGNASTISILSGHLNLARPCSTRKAASSATVGAVAPGCKMMYTAFFAIDGIRHGDQLCVQDRWMLADEGFYFFATNFFATAVDVVAEPPLKSEVRVSVDGMGGNDVTGADEAIRRERFGVGFRCLVVTARGRRATETQLAHFSFGRRSLGFGDQDTNFIVRAARFSIGAVSNVWRR